MKWLLTASSTEGAILRYVEWLASVGVQGSVVLPTKQNLDPRAYDAVLLTGGGDVDPAWYGEVLSPETCLVNRDRDAFELRLAEQFMNLGRPVLGVCRGLQVIHVALGGKLIQHLPPGVVEKHKGLRDLVHTVKPVLETRLGSALAEATAINSTHHQAIAPDHLGRDLRVAAWSGDGVIEAVEGVGRASLVSAVQWHPERMEPAGNPVSNELIAFWMALVRTGALR